MFYHQSRISHQENIPVEINIVSADWSGSEKIDTKQIYMYLFPCCNHQLKTMRLINNYYQCLEMTVL